MLTKQNIYFIGIGGIGMSALARYFCHLGKQVAGYDRTPSTITNELLKVGAVTHFEDAVSNIPAPFLNANDTVVIYTPAVPKDHLELNYFINEGFTVIKRAEALDALTNNSFSFACAGTHGKTTTSSILGYILDNNGVNPTAFIGGILENYQSNLIMGGTEVTVAEADEFDRSFLQLHPNIACITSTDADHLDIYGTAAEIEATFKQFASQVKDTLFVRKGIPIDGLTYDVESPADYQANNLRVENGTCIFDIITPTDTFKNATLHMPGRHNVSNALVAVAMATTYGVPLEKAAKSLASFKGINRRFSKRIDTQNRVLIDDYAHHPTEIDAVVSALREMYPDEKILGIFQPHTFSRTKDFVDGFAKSLSAFDELLLLDIYPARELPMEGVTSQWLLDKVTLQNKKLVQKEEVLPHIQNSNIKVVAMVGAGDIGVLIGEVCEGLKL